MLDTIQQFFNQALSAPEQADDREVTLELAAAALLCEIIRADYQTEPTELQSWREALQYHLHIDDTAVDELMTLAQQEVEDAVDHYQFVSLIKEHYAYHDRVELVGLMWRLAYADEELDPLEEHRIRRLAELLHVSHSDFIRTKLAVQENHGESQ
ncbi:tellurite resistance TerB family protein [Aidingimonas lacisalsi]|uniref:tellurite resistance TerB family protein n=1 Tax=Aidingimonas lacisalsi TaxID=2604086 RepID=UPI0011D29085|nr:TerB family tellurite resistance protein [Aidingimonas lacisalsi]